MIRRLKGGFSVTMVWLLSQYILVLSSIQILKKYISDVLNVSWPIVSKLHVLLCNASSDNGKGCINFMLNLLNDVL